MNIPFSSVLLGLVIHLFIFGVPVALIILGIVYFIFKKKRKQLGVPVVAQTGKLSTAMIVCAIVVPLIYLAAEMEMLIYTSFLPPAYSAGTIALYVVLYLIYAVMLMWIFLFIRMIYTEKGSIQKHDKNARQ